MCLLTVLSFALSGCNAKEEDDPDYAPSTSVAVTSFKLKSNSTVMEHLDSVFFSIDLEHGVIFNADSLPMGSPITKLVPVIQYADGVSAATLRMEHGALMEGQTNYLTSPNDTIDFSGDVILTLTAQDGVTTRDYRIKVNVHKVKPDSLSFDKQALSTLPSRLSSPLKQKTVPYKEGVLTLIEESDHSLTAATSNRGKEWVKLPVNLTFTPDVRSLTVTDDVLYILDTAGVLYTSQNGLDWMATGKTWVSITGAYGSELLGVRSEGGKYLHTSLSGKYPEAEVAADFPVYAATNMLCLTNQWAVDPIGFVTGGRRIDGSLCAGTWGFDGHSWAYISNTPTPALQQACAAPYFVYKQTSAMWKQTEFPIMMILGGRLADGSINKTTYISIDNGVNWTEAPANLSLPETIPAGTDADVVVLSTPMLGSLTANWADQPNKIRQRLNYKVEGYDIYWDCPYLYYFGGVKADGSLNDLIWRGVLARLTFTPLI